MYVTLIKNQFLINRPEFLRFGFCFYAIGNMADSHGRKMLKCIECKSSLILIDAWIHQTSALQTARLGMARYGMAHFRLKYWCRKCAHAKCVQCSCSVTTNALKCKRTKVFSSLERFPHAQRTRVLPQFSKNRDLKREMRAILENANENRFERAKQRESTRERVRERERAN